MKIRVQGPDALAFLERVCANRIDKPVGSVVYTAMLTPRGGIRCDLTVTRHEDDVFMVVTGGGSGMHDLAWLRAAGPRRGAGADLRRLEPFVRARAVRAARSRHPGRRDGCRRLERGLPVHDGPRARYRRGARVRTADQLRGRARLGAVRAVRHGRAGLGRAVGGRPPSGADRRRARRVRFAPPGEGVSTLGPGHPHGVRPDVGGARLRGEVGQGLPGQGRARADPGCKDPRSGSSR